MVVLATRKGWSHIGKPQLLAAQRCKCFYCGRFMARRKATRDHLWPRSMGRNLVLNQVMCCGPCNTRKDCRLPTDRELARARVIYVRCGGPAFAF